MAETQVLIQVIRTQAPIQIVVDLEDQVEVILAVQVNQVEVV